MNEGAIARTRPSRFEEVGALEAEPHRVIAQTLAHRSSRSGPMPLRSSTAATVGSRGPATTVSLRSARRPTLRSRHMIAGEAAHGRRAVSARMSGCRVPEHRRDRRRPRSSGFEPTALTVRIASSPAAAANAPCHGESSSRPNRRMRTHAPRAADSVLDRVIAPAVTPLVVVGGAPSSRMHALCAEQPPTILLAAASGPHGRSPTSAKRPAAAVEHVLGQRPSACGP